MHIVEHAAGGETDADAVGAPDGDDGGGDFQGEAGAVLDRATVTVCTLIGTIAQELVEEVAVGVVDFDAVEAGLLGEASPADVFGHDTRHFLDSQGARYDVVSHGLPGPELALRGDGGGGHGEFAVRLVVGVRDATDVPEL